MYSQIKAQRELESAIMQAITENYSDEHLPETVLLAVRLNPEPEVIVLGDYLSARRDIDTSGYTVEEIDTDNLQDNVAETASLYFDPRYN